VSLPVLRPGAAVEKRRSQRILLTVPIFVSGIRMNNAPFTEHTTTVAVNAHGALIRLREAVTVGQLVKVTNIGIEEEVVCTVDVDSGEPDEPMVGIEFAQPNARFWRVSFPPLDWNLRSPEAKQVTKSSLAADKPQLAKKQFPRSDAER